jgi:hypothetical protein
LDHFDWLGYLVMAITLVTVALMYLVHKQVPEAAPKDNVSPGQAAILRESD